MEQLFWGACFFVFYTYAGYPLLVALLAYLIPRPVNRGSCTPYVSVVIAACNEEEVIARRIDNLLAQDYPAPLYQIIIVSDGSTDCTNQIVASYALNNVLLIALQERCGKAAALNHGVSRAEGEIVVFADARQSFARDALTLLAANFADHTVGCVSGELVLVEGNENGIRVEMGAYWCYEKVIRHLESASASVVGVTGAIYGIRKHLYLPLPSGTILDDVLIPMNIVRQGFRAVFDSAPKAYDQMSTGLEQEWARKVRTLAGNLQLLQISPWLVLPWRSPLWWRFLSHKIFRLFVPLALICLLCASFCCRGVPYRLTLWAQLILYLTALAGYLVPPLRKLRMVNLVIFFIVLNLAAVAGFWLWVSGRCDSSWRPVYAK